MLLKKLTKRDRLLILIAAGLIAISSVLPLWIITLDAPQYPERLGMIISAHSLKGEGEHDIKNINLLNHYIGMKTIEPDSIPELEYMPWILGYLILIAIVAAAVNRMFMMPVMLFNLVVIAVVGLVDFYLWEYDYGHNLSPEAPIKIPGMVYQPPLIACKQLLNINACSFPHIGSILIMIAGLIYACVLYSGRKGAVQN